jgi:oxygen-independent coproporphyrinogen-3 oxidase
MSLIVRSAKNPAPKHTPIVVDRQGPENPPDPNDLATFRLPKPLGSVYLHLPFCFHKCHYCDFYSIVEPAQTPEQPPADRQAAFTDALCGEILTRSEQTAFRPTTLFAGGGTPTYLRPGLWERLLQTLRDVGWIGCPGITPEFTVEANPETVTPELMHRLAAGGVNRVSIGAQSFDRRSLKQLERWHDPESVPRAVQCCRDAGITNLSLDLIFAIPGQTLAMLERDLDALLALQPTHLSTYGLTYEPNTPLTAKLRVGQVRRVEEDLERDMYELVLDKLEAAGFEHYEVSNWAKSEVNSEQSTVNSSVSRADCSLFTVHRTKCAHNLAYWHNHDWLGLGPSAASHVRGHRWRNAPNLARYLQDAPTPPITDHEHLPPDQSLGERLMLGLRLREGLDAGWLLGHPDLREHQRQAIDASVRLGFLEQADGRLRLTRKGLFVADSVIAQVL